MSRLAVVGVGRIGGEVAYLAASLGIVDELVLYDHNPALLKAQVLDLEHTGLQTSISTEKRDIKNADVCVFAAGLPRDPTVKTRADLLNANLPATRECATLLAGFSGILVTVTNPMDINNFYLKKMTGMERERCIGFGGQLDSARFALALKKREIAGSAYVLGEHGEHQVPVFSLLTKPVSVPQREEILTGLRGASMPVIQGKGGTVYGPVLHIVHLIHTILDNTKKRVICSSVLEGEYGINGCSLGVPAWVNRNGICEIEEWELDDWEKTEMDDAGRFAASLCRQVTP
ncbi:MAG: lactate dehydrogenase [Methanoregula sp.]|nr:lactate dehydrogenase [Methanoregula sp.]